MKIKFLGTAAAEGWPAVFCNCENCKKAARLGGKDLRTRSQILVNNDLLVDLPPDTYYHKMAYSLDLSAVKTLLVTHSHMDHFYPMELSMRGACYAHDMTSPALKIYCDEGVRKSYEVESGFEHFAKEVDGAIEWNIVQPFDGFESAGYEIYALKAHHMATEKALFYLIKHGDKSFMQCNDTGFVPEENFEFLNKLGIKIDVISLDCTCGKQEIGKNGTHMGAPDCVKVVELMRKSNFVHENTKFIVTHFSHNGGMTYNELTEYFKPYNVAVAYDGMEVEI